MSSNLHAELLRSSQAIAILHDRGIVSVAESRRYLRKHHGFDLTVVGDDFAIPLPEATPDQPRLEDPEIDGFDNAGDIS